MPTKLPDREKAMIKEAQAPGLEAEAEADRELLCDMILVKLEQAQTMVQTQASGFGAAGQRETMSSTAQGSQVRRAGANRGSSRRAAAATAGGASDSPDERALQGGGTGAASAARLESISIATYTCDFGDVVVGATKRKSFRLTNVGRLPVTFNFDKKVLGQAGIAIEPDKVQKVMPHSSTIFTVVYATRKNARFGK